MSLAYAIILDFEATCEAGTRLQPQEIIEFPSVLLRLDPLETVDEFLSFVRPHHHPVLTEFCQQLTSIAQSDVDAAASFPVVLAQHQAWLGGHGLSERNALIVTCGDWDLGTMMPAQCAAVLPPITALPAIYRRWQNLKRTFCALRNRQGSPGMAKMMRDLHLTPVGRAHRGIDDCRNLAELYKELLRRGAAVEVTGQSPA